jgi:4-diphosphocytidyl-2-C-methyl-D-erythritol kinase
MGNITPTLTCPAPAKLNLFLHVTGRRPDGYHLLQTVFRFIDLNDTLHFSLRVDGKVQRVNVLEGVPMEQDLCVRAARLLQQSCSCKLGVDIRLDKHIPMGGGLGGGSSDAATTLLALNKLWQLGLDRKALLTLGLTLGADVPVFLFGDNAYAEGVGEELQAFPLPDAWYIVLFPPVQVPTVEIFTHPELTRDTNSITIRALPIGQHLSTVKWLVNDLQEVVCKLHPEVAHYLAVLGAYAPAMMTGSGACIFAEFISEAAAQQVMQQLPKEIQGVVVHGLTQHPLKDFVV